VSVDAERTCTTGRQVQPLGVPGLYWEVIKLAKAKGIPFNVPGHFTEGQCQWEGCTRPPRTEYDEEFEQLVERPGRYSRLLQLFIGEVDT
jgi:hypothetical protein